MNQEKNHTRYLNDLCFTEQVLIYQTVPFM